MTLHHIKDVSKLLNQIYAALVPGGTICLTDLDLDGGLFHEDNTGVFHFGFDRQELRKAFSETGFIDVRDTTATEIMKPDKNKKREKRNKGKDSFKEVAYLRRENQAGLMEIRGRRNIHESSLILF